MVDGHLLPSPPPARGVRLHWEELPDRVRSGVEAVLGAAVVSADSQPGGFSPGSADRVLLADGRRAFVKAVGTSPNPDSPRIHRREVDISSVLPREAPVPRFLGAYDDGDWVALVLEDVAGHTPPQPWTAADRDRVLSALEVLLAQLTPCPLPTLPHFADELSTDFARWSRLLTEPPDDLDPWLLRHGSRLATAAAQSLAMTRSDARPPTLLHTDLRADNVLLTDDGRVVFVDWPWATQGPAWCDLVLFLLNPLVFGGLDPDPKLDGHPLLEDVPDAAVTGVIAGLAAYFLDVAREPEPRGLPTIRAFQRAQGQACAGWLRNRTGWA